MARFSALSAAVVALAFSSQVAGQAALDPCVQKSIRDAGCGPTDIKCMCKGAAEGNFLTDVLTSMVQYCPNTVDASGLFSQLSGGCKSAGFQIPPKNIADAQQLAGSVFSGGSGSGSGSGSAAGGSADSGSATTNQPSGTPKPTPMITAGAGLPVSQPSVIGESTAVISTGGAAASNGSLIVAPSATPKPNAGSGSSSGGSSSSSSGDSTGSGSSSGNTSSGTSSSQSSSTSGKPENAGVRSTASLGAAVIGLAAAVMMW